MSHHELSFRIKFNEKIGDWKTGIFAEDLSHRARSRTEAPASSRIIALRSLISKVSLIA